MATSSTYYIDTNNFSTATSVYTDVALSTKAPDGFYSFSGIYRQQLFGKLQSVSNCSGESNNNVRINYIVNLSGGISYGSFAILVNGSSVYSTTSNASGYIEVPYNSSITAIVSAPIGDTSGGSTITFYTRVIANDSNGLLSDSGSDTSNASASIGFNATSEIYIQADGSVTGGGEGPQIN
jgi:hypothetical protein